MAPANSRTSCSTLDILAWADDLLVFANSKQELESKLSSLVKVLRLNRLDVTPDSLEWTCTHNRHFHDKGTLLIPHGDGPVSFKFKKKGFNVLGVWNDPSSENSTMWKHRLQEAHLSWMGHKEQLCRRRVPLTKRILRWQATVGKTLLWCCGAWTMTKNISRKTIFPTRLLPQHVGTTGKTRRTLESHVYQTDASDKMHA